jgi:hypothetical protein
MLNPEAQDADELFASDSVSMIAPPVNELATEEVEDIEAEAEEKADIEAEAEEEADIEAEAEEEAEDGSDNPQRQKLTEAERQRLFVIIDRMRIAGDNWEKIARHIASQGFSTISGKGSWRGVMAKTLYEKMLNE